MASYGAFVVTIILAAGAALYYHKLVVDSYESALFDVNLRLASANARAAEHLRLWTGMSIWNATFARAARIDSTCPDVAYFVESDAARRTCADKIVVAERALEDARTEAAHWKSRFHTEEMISYTYKRTSETFRSLWNFIRDQLKIECFDNIDCPVSPNPCLAYTCRRFKCNPDLAGGAECFESGQCESMCDDDGYDVDFCNQTSCHCDHFSVNWRPVLDYYGYPKWYPVKYAYPLVPAPGME